MSDVDFVIAIEDDMQILKGNTLDYMLEFYTDTAGTIPMDLTGYSFVMDISTEQDGCCIKTPTDEQLTVGNGLTLEINVSKVQSFPSVVHAYKILTSAVGRYFQSITGTSPAGKVTTFERGKLKIIALNSNAAN